ncbi:MAG TPA: hypothetical protein VMS92_21695 [Mycobacterium sp.]|nr:hypothetical protein [Mycobacterium sp.]
MSNQVAPIAGPAPMAVGNMDRLDFNHRVVLGATGAISSQDAAALTGVVAVKTATKTGRYTLTLANGRKFKQFRGGNVSIVGLTDAIYGANTTGYKHHFRNDLLSTAGTIEVQFTRNTDNADAEVPDNFVLVIDLSVKTR